jgi:hypothetical protein
MSRPRLLVLAVSVGLLAATASVAQLEPERQGQDNFISRAVGVSGKVWLLTDAGALSTIDEESSDRTAMTIPEPALDIWSQDGTVAAITGKRSGQDTWSIRFWRDASWATVRTVPIANDTLLASSYSSGTLVLLTDRRIISIVGDKVQSARIAWPKSEPIFGVASVHVTGDQLLVGFNKGEWGGGLKSIGRFTGKVVDIESTTDRAHGNLLNSGYDPVNGIVDEPGKPGCVLAAVGLVHIMAHGRIIEVCGTEVKRAVWRPAPAKAFEVDGKKLDPDYDTGSAVFGLISVGDQVWASSTSGMISIGRNGAPEESPLPKFKLYGSVYASFEVPHIVLVLTEINRRRSVSGAVPLLVAR